MKLVVLAGPSVSDCSGFPPCEPILDFNLLYPIRCLMIREHFTFPILRSLVSIKRLVMFMPTQAISVRSP